VVVDDTRVAALTEPLLLAYLHPGEAAARWKRINADGSRIVLLITPDRIAGRQQVREPAAPAWVPDAIRGGVVPHGRRHAQRPYAVSLVVL
jgi:hypothetical protein